MTDQPAKRDDLMDLADACGVTRPRPLADHPLADHPLAGLEQDCADIAPLFEWLADFDPGGGTR